MTVDKIRVDEAVQSALASLKAIVTIISGIAATTAIVQLLAIADGDLGKIQLLPTLLFSILLLTVVRFYHGNCRHLDDEYAGRLGKGYVKPAKVGVSARVASDFLIIFFEALLLVTLSLLLSAPRQFILVFSTLLLIDAVWFFFLHHTTHPRSKPWALNNLFFGVIMLGIGIVFLDPEDVNEQAVRAATFAFSVAALINLAIDFANQFELYFPGERNVKEIFLSAPFTGMRNDSGLVDDDFRRKLYNLYDGLTHRGYKVFSAHIREEWGGERDIPEEALAQDLDGLESADVLVAIVGDPFSPGVQLEIGAALILNKPIIIINYPPGSQMPYLNYAFQSERFRKMERAHFLGSSDPESWTNDVVKILGEIGSSSRGD